MLLSHGTRLPLGRSFAIGHVGRVVRRANRLHGRRADRHAGRRASVRAITTAASEITGMKLAANRRFAIRTRKRLIASLRPIEGRSFRDITVRCGANGSDIKKWLPRWHPRTSAMSQSSSVDLQPCAGRQVDDAGRQVGNVTNVGGTNVSYRTGIQYLALEYPESVC
jgi:hypothetical protein